MLPKIPDPKQDIERAFVHYLLDHSDFNTQPDGPALISLAEGSDRQTEVEKPYIMVLCDFYQERGAKRFTFAAHVIYVQSIDDSNVTRKEWCAKIWNRLRWPVTFIHNDEVKIYGWSLPVPRELSDSQDTGDSFDIQGGGEIVVLEAG